MIPTVNINLEWTRTSVDSKYDPARSRALTNEALEIVRDGQGDHVRIFLLSIGCGSVFVQASERVKSHTQPNCAVVWRLLL